MTDAARHPQIEAAGSFEYGEPRMSSDDGDLGGGAGRGSPTVSSQLRELLLAAGYKKYRHVATVAAIIGIRGRSVRRKLDGELAFTEQELRLILNELGFEYRGLEGIARHDTGAQEEPNEPEGEEQGRYEVKDVELNGEKVTCTVWTRKARTSVPAARSTVLAISPDGKARLARTNQLRHDETPLLIEKIEINRPYEYEGTGPAVLVVDQDENTGNAVAAGLTNAGFRASAVSSIAALDERLAEGHHEAFLVTCGTSHEFETRKLAEQIRSKAATQPIILVTEFGGNEDDLLEIATTFGADIAPAISSTKMLAFAITKALLQTDAARNQVAEEAR